MPNLKEYDKDGNCKPEEVQDQDYDHIPEGQDGETETRDFGLHDRKVLPNHMDAETESEEQNASDMTVQAAKIDEQETSNAHTITNFGGILAAGNAALKQDGNIEHHAVETASPGLSGSQKESKRGPIPLDGTASTPTANDVTSRAAGEIAKGEGAISNRASENSSSEQAKTMETNHNCASGDIAANTIKSPVISKQPKTKVLEPIQPPRQSIASAPRHLFSSNLDQSVDLTELPSGSSNTSSDEEDPSTAMPCKSLFGNPKASTASKRKYRKEEFEDLQPKKQKLAENKGRETEETQARTNEMVAIIVGPDQLILIAEMSKLMEISDYFRKALGNPFKESETRTFAFQDESYMAVWYFITWMYSQNEHPPGRTKKPVDILSMKLYCFAERIQCRKLQNALITQFYQAIKEQCSPRSTVRLENVAGYLCPHAIQYAKNRLPEGCNLMSLILWYWLLCVNEKRLDDIGWDKTTYPGDFHIRASFKFLEAGFQLHKRQFPPLSNFLYGEQKKV